MAEELNIVGRWCGDSLCFTHDLDDCSTVSTIQVATYSKYPDPFSVEINEDDAKKIIAHFAKVFGWEK